MKRRMFLSGVLGAATASLFARASLAGESGDGMSGMPGMADMTHAPAPAPLAPLAAVDALAAGAPLANLRTLANESREAGVFRATLIAQPAAHALLADTPPTTFWQYDSGAANNDGPMIGPLIDVREGDRVEIRFVNRLAQPTTIHWHGLPVPPDQDGNPANPIAPGAAHVYRFTLPKGSAGTYWYHPRRRSRCFAGWRGRSSCGPPTIRSRTGPSAICSSRT